MNIRITGTITATNTRTGKTHRRSVDFVVPSESSWIEIVDEAADRAFYRNDDSDDGWENMEDDLHEEEVAS